MHALPLAEGRNEGGHYFHNKNITALFREYNRALPPYNRVATILGIFPLFWGVPLFKTPEGVVVGFQIFAWAPN